MNSDIGVSLREHHVGSQSFHEKLVSITNKEIKEKAVTRTVEFPEVSVNNLALWDERLNEFNHVLASFNDCDPSDGRIRREGMNDQPEAEART